MSVYVSTSCLKGKSDVFDILGTYLKVGIVNVELGTGRQPVERLSTIKNYVCNFVVHHYFPPPRDAFIVNLASQDKTLLARSREQIKASIEFCHRYHSKLFTFHAGFRADPDSNFRFSTKGPIASYQAAFNTFVESVKEINAYAETRGVKLAIENNVLSESNIIEGKNQFFLLCEAIEFEQLWDQIQTSNVGLLLDLGHLQVTSTSLKYDKHAFIEKLKHKIFALHINDNNGRIDTHSVITKTSWCLQVIRSSNFMNIPIILESSNDTIEQIVEQIQLIDNMLPCDRAPEQVSYV
jgi:uncharacterized protein (UPF0276 family)